MGRHGERGGAPSGRLGLAKAGCRSWVAARYTESVPESRVRGGDPLPRWYAVLVVISRSSPR